MAKIKFNSIVDDVSGQFGNIVFRSTSRGIVLANKPDMSGHELSEDQVAHRERFREAVAYGKTVMADAAVRPLYEQAAEDKDMPIFALMIADFFNAPSIKEVDLSAYNGQVDGAIKIKATDDFGVVNTRVSIIDDAEGTTIENGFASETGPGSGLWVYTATTAVPAGTTVSIQVIATDRPGGTAVNSQLKAL